MNIETLTAIIIVAAILGLGIYLIIRSVEKQKKTIELEEPVTYEQKRDIMVIIDAYKAGKITVDRGSPVAMVNYKITLKQTLG